MAYHGPEKPYMRPVDVHPFESDGTHGFVLSDPLHIAEQPIFVSGAALAVLELADGEHTPEQIRSDIARATGSIVPLDHIEQLFGTLDEHLYLDGSRFRQAYRAARDEYLARPARPAALAGVAYPENPAELRGFLDGLFLGPAGPGMPDRNGSHDHLKALVAPHIDLRRGGGAFAHAYKALAEGSDADVFVILGIAHAGAARPYIITEKDFETPLGVVPTDRGMVRRLRELSPPEALGDEFAHKSEHSIEFQTVFLRYLYPEKEFTIVPILCGSLHEALLENRPPIAQPAVAGFVDALRRVIEESGKGVCVVAAVDLAHIGKRFGDGAEADEMVLRWVEAEDRTMLDTVLARDATGFFRSLEKDHDRRHVCGYPAIYTMLSLFERCGSRAPTAGRLLCYEQAPEPESGSAVTFASMAFS